MELRLRLEDFASSGDRIRAAISVGQCLTHYATWAPLFMELQALLVNMQNTGARLFKLMMPLVNVSLKFQTLISQIRQYFLLKKCEKLLQCSAKLLTFFQQKISLNLVIKS